MSHSSETDRQCTHINARSRRCRMLRAPNHNSLCAHHLKQAASAVPDQETLTAELLADTGYLSSAREVNALLGNVVHQFARKRIDRKDAMAFAFLSQLLLNSLTPLGKQIAVEERAERQRYFDQQMQARRAAYLAQQAAQQPAQQEAANSQQPPKTYFDLPHLR